MDTSTDPRGSWDIVTFAFAEANAMLGDVENTDSANPNGDESGLT
jgi:hypothetical protein